MPNSPEPNPTRRSFLRSGAAFGTLANARAIYAADLNDVQAEVEKHHEENLRRLQTWIRQPSIAAENRGMSEGCDLMMRMLRDAGFGQVAKIPSGGHPGVFATLDAGAARTLGIYFM